MRPTKKKSTITKNSHEITVLDTLEIILKSDYYSLNIDVREFNIDPINHFFEYGLFENRDFSIIFDQNYLNFH